MPIRAITLDLDDTLWPIWPTIDRAEHLLHDWLAQHAPRTAERYPMTAMRELRNDIVAQHPHMAHDFAAQRRMTLNHAVRHSGEDVGLAEAAFELFTVHRNIVDPFPGAFEALARLAGHFPIAALTNGSADLGRIGIDQHFVFLLGAHEHGAAKPDASIFRAACNRLEVRPEEVLHVGDHPEMDVLGAQRAGLRAAWINRDAATWPEPHLKPDYVVFDLAELVEQLECELSLSQESSCR